MKNNSIKRLQLDLEYKTPDGLIKQLLYAFDIATKGQQFESKQRSVGDGSMMNFELHLSYLYKRSFKTIEVDGKETHIVESKI